ncbi:hypothetical protein [Streptomyces sp. NBC_01296]|uniref:hypothetical protein n=1 Tax=Streptomyces sp. NBC_01296 TaxID=2903816 RepID=UPI002E15CAFC|nr:hypothetical protein OG299_23000 [Streptomyces sp. NBC_01296]
MGSNISGSSDSRSAAAPAGLDWAVLSPAGDFAPEPEPGGGYAFGPADAADRIAHADFARAVLDEVRTPTVHRAHTGVAAASRPIRPARSARPPTARTPGSPSTSAASRRPGGSRGPGSRTCC